MLRFAASLQIQPVRESNPQVCLATVTLCHKGIGLPAALQVVEMPAHALMAGALTGTVEEGASAVLVQCATPGDSAVTAAAAVAKPTPSRHTCCCPCCAADSAGCSCDRHKLPLSRSSQIGAALHLIQFS